MKKYIIISSLFLFLSCVKKKDTAEETNKDSIKEITINREKAQKNCGIETLLDDAERSKAKFKEDFEQIKDERVKDSLMIQLTRRVSQVLDSVNTINNQANKKEIFQNEIENYQERIKELSLKIEKSEEGTYVLAPSEFFKEMIGSKHFQKYARFYQLLDATQQVSNKKYDPEAYRKNCLDWEQYIQSTKDAQLKSEAKNYYKSQVKKFLFGTEQEKTFDSSTKKFNQSIEENFIYVIKKHPNTVTADLTKKFMKYFYEYTDKSETKSFYKSLHTTTMENIDKAFSE